MQSTTKFEVDFKGSETGKRYQGLFTVRVKTTHRDTIAEDQIRRNILGSNPQDAGAEAASLARAAAYCSVRLVGPEFPAWWRESDGGLVAEDANVLVEVNNKAVKAVEAELATAATDAEAAKKKIKTAADEDDE